MLLVKKIMYTKIAFNVATMHACNQHTNVILGCAPPMNFILLLPCTAFISYSEYLKRDKHSCMPACVPGLRGLCSSGCARASPAHLDSF